jgi:hypothetical protein
MVLYDVATIGYRPRDGAIAEMDLVFCQRKSELRRFKSYRAPDEKMWDRKIEKFAEPSKPQL